MKVQLNYSVSHLVEQHKTQSSLKVFINFLKEMEAYFYKTPSITGKIKLSLGIFFIFIIDKNLYLFQFFFFFFLLLATNVVKNW